MGNGKRVRLIIWILTVLAVVGGISAFILYGWVAKPNVTVSEPTIIHIGSNEGFENLVTTLTEKRLLKHPKSFRRIAKWMQYQDPNIKGGRYTIDPGMSNRALITRLRAGQQTPVHLTINNARTVAELAGKFANKLEADSTTFLAVFTDSSAVEQLGKTHENIMSLFIPNTYEFFWNSKPTSVLQRMLSEQDRFWKQEQREEKLVELGLTREQVYTLASIVEKETQSQDERPIVAGLYLNRIAQGIPLQADPTVVFATGQFDLRRVLNKHLEIDSPYNTYKYPGLPPGPIYMPSINSIDAVLNAQKHDYLYMCAKPGFSGRHVFASSLAGHSINANRYRRWLNQNGIK